MFQRVVGTQIFLRYDRMIRNIYVYAHLQRRKLFFFFFFFFFFFLFFFFFFLKKKIFFFFFLKKLFFSISKPNHLVLGKCRKKTILVWGWVLFGWAQNFFFFQKKKFVFFFF